MISAVVLTKNEEKNILACLHSLDWCDEIIIVDDYSEDKTVQLVESVKDKKIKLFQRHLYNDFSAQRNFGLEKTMGDWVIFIDADERVSVSLQYEIASVINESIDNYSGYYMQRVDMLWGRPLRFGETARLKLLRLARKNSGIWVGHVHEIWDIHGKKGQLKNPLNHFPHQTVKEFLQEINFYTNIRASELFKKKVTAQWSDIILYPIAKFIKNYFFKLGFLDGIPGMMVAILMSFHSFLVRGKLWLIWQKNGK